jgi:hypothetical protein
MAQKMVPFAKLYMDSILHPRKPNHWYNNNFTPTKAQLQELKAVTKQKKFKRHYTTSFGKKNRLVA